MVPVGILELDVACQQFAAERLGQCNEDYVGALIDQRLASEPLLLTRPAEALRRGTVTLPDDCAAEFAELGGSNRLQQLADDAWDDMDADDQRLLVLALIDSVFVDPDGETVADRVHTAWRF